MWLGSSHCLCSSHWEEFSSYPEREFLFFLNELFLSCCLPGHISVSPRPSVKGPCGNKYIVYHTELQALLDGLGSEGGCRFIINCLGGAGQNVLGDNKNAVGTYEHYV